MGSLDRTGTQHMGERPRRTFRLLVATSVLAGTVSLGGCAGGFDGVELQGGIFDALGVSGTALGGKRVEPKTEARAPLVLPPDNKRLPEPGSAPPPVTGALPDPNWPRDRDQIREARAADAKRRQQEHCKDNNWKQRAHQDDVGADSGPEGRCTNSVFTTLSRSLFGGD
jgi:hypothetical protein